MLKASATEQADPYKTACFSPCSGLGLWALIFLAAALWTRLWVLFQCQQAVVGQWYFMQGLKHMIGLFSDQDLGVQTWKFSIFGFFQDDSGGWVWRVEREEWLAVRPTRKGQKSDDAMGFSMIALFNFIAVLSVYWLCPFLQMRNLRLREVKWPARDHATPECRAGMPTRLFVSLSYGSV